MKEPERQNPRDVTVVTLQVLVIGLLIAAGFWTVRPFLTSLIWAVIIVVATWPVMLRIQALLWGKRWLADLVMTFGLLMLLVVPLTVTVSTIVDSSDELVARIRSLSTLTLAPPPGWLKEIPMLGPKLAESWEHLGAASAQELSSRLIPYTNEILSWFVSQAGNIGMMFLHFLITVIIAAVLYARGEKARDGMVLLARRLAGRQGEDSLVLGAKAIRGVALGVGLTALIQTVIGGIGLAVTGMPALLVLCGLMLVFCIAQLGPGLVLVPSAVWLYWSGQTVGGTVLLIVTVMAGTIDNLLRPFLIRKGANLPLLLIFSGVIGGLVAFGIIGLFIGPVVLAVIFTLLQEWVSGHEAVAYVGPPEDKD